MHRSALVVLVACVAVSAVATPALATTDRTEIRSPESSDPTTAGLIHAVEPTENGSTVSIQDIQRPANESSTTSPYTGETVTTSGVVTAVRADSSGYYLQNGTGPYTGVYVYTGGTTNVTVGDRVTITAPVSEYYGLTELDASGAVSANVIGTATVPSPVSLAAGDVGQEAYEGVLVEVTNVTATRTPGTEGEWTVSDGRGNVTIDDVSAGDDTTPARVNEPFDRIVGPVTYSYGEYKIQPTRVTSGAIGSTVTVLAYTDIGSEAAGDGTMGRFISLIQQRRQALSGAVVVVGNGDELSPHALRGKVTPGWKPPIRALNIIDPAAEAVQNHELDYDESAETGTFSIFEAASNASHFPWVNANVHTGTHGIPGTQNHTIVTRGNQTIGIFSVADSAIDSKAGNVLSRNGYTVENYTRIAREQATYLKTEKHVDVVIALAPIGNELARELARDTEYVDAIITGDRDSSFGPTVIDGAVVAHPPGGASGIAELKLTVTNGSVTPLGGRIHRVTEALSRNSTWAEYIDQVRATYGLEAVIARTEVPLSTTVDPYDSETAMGNAITTGVRQFTGADVAITNAGGIRGSATYGPNITASAIRSTLSFGNQVVTLNVTGAELYAILESQMFVHQNDGGPSIGLQASGVTFEWIPHNRTDIPDTVLDEGFGRLDDVHVGGEPLDRNATYTLATNSYIGTGASDYPMSESQWVREYNTTMAEAVITWLERKGTLTREDVSPTVQGNMRMVDRIVKASGASVADGTVTVTATVPSAVETVTDRFYLRNATAGRVNATDVSLDGSTLTLTFTVSDWKRTVDAAPAQIYGRYSDSEYTPQIRNETSQTYAVLNVEVATDPITGVGNGEWQPTDPDGDGRTEDVNGDGTADISDVQWLLNNRHRSAVAANPDAFDFDGDGEVTVGDVLALFEELY